MGAWDRMIMPYGGTGAMPQAEKSSRHLRCMGGRASPLWALQRPYFELVGLNQRTAHPCGTRPSRTWGEHRAGTATAILMLSVVLRSPGSADQINAEQAPRFWTVSLVLLSRPSTPRRSVVTAATKVPNPVPDAAVAHAESDASDRHTGVVLLRSRLLTGDHHSGQTTSWAKSP